MIDVKKLYPECAKEETEIGSFYGPGSYQPIIDALGKVVIQVDDDDYQGDSRILYKKGKKFGILFFGWGSCSGCDRLQACSSIADIQQLADSLEDNIQWFDSLSKLKKYVNEKDWELDSSWHADETKDFITKIKEYK